MDTNALNAILVALKSQGESDSVVIAGKFFAAVAPIIACFVMWLQNKATKVAVDEIHTAVNSERTATTKEIKELREKVLALSTDQAARIQKETTVAEKAIFEAGKQEQKDLTPTPPAKE